MTTRDMFEKARQLTLLATFNARAGWFRFFFDECNSLLLDFLSEN